MKRIVPALVVLSLSIGGAYVSGREAEGPRLWAVLVSIERYGAPIPGRPGLGSDGKQLARWLTETAGWEAEHVLELNDNGNPRPGGDPAAPSLPLRPTGANLDWALEKWLERRVKKGDVVLIAFSGRGAAIGKEEKLLPIDYRIGDEGWSPDRGIARLVRESKCSSVLCWIDAPFLDLEQPKISRAGAGDQLLNRLARWPGSWVWMTTGEDPPASGNAFAAALRTSLGDGHRPLLASFIDLDRDPAARRLGFRQLGGVPAGLNLSRDLLRAPRGEGVELLVQGGHADRIAGIVIRGDGRVMATASRDSTIRVWDPAARQRALIRVLPEFLNGVTALALSPDGRYVVGGDAMGQLVAWDLSLGNSGPLSIVNGLKPHDKMVKALAFLPEGPASSRGKPSSTRFVSAGQDGRCELWEVDGRILNHKPVLSPKSKEVWLSAASNPSGPAAFSIIDEDGLLRVYDRDKGQSLAMIRVPGGRPTALLLDPDGRWAAVGNEAGQVKVIELPNGRVVLDQGPLSGPISMLKVGPDRLLAVGTGNGVSLVPIDHPDRLVRLDAGHSPIDKLEFSPDGGWLAACDSTGELFTWKLAAGRQPEPIRLDRAGEGLAAFSRVAFGPSPVTPMLVAGENDGGIRRWDLETGKEYPRLSPHRGQVRQVSATPDGRFLLQLSKDGVAQVWDLKEGRSVRSLEGSFSAGAFLPDGRLAMARDPNTGGGIVLVEAKGGRPVPDVVLSRPAGFSADFGRVVVSKDGRRIAATSMPGRDELAFVWTLNGSPPRVLEGHDRSLTAIDFSDDGQTLLTAAEDGHILLWELEGEGAVQGRRQEIPAPPVNAITAAKLAPGEARRVIAAGLTDQDKGVVFYWDDKASSDGKPGRFVKLGEAPGRVLSVTFLGGGRFVAAAGRDGRILAWELTEGRPPGRAEIRETPIRIGPDHAHHNESINDLITWPLREGPALVSGSDDSTIRFWTIEPGPGSRTPMMKLLGTLSTSLDANARPISPGRIAGPGTGTEAPWVAFTPEGVYDSSLEGESLVTFSDGQGVEPLDQYASKLFHPLLTDDIRRGSRPSPNAYSPPPPLLIQAPEDRGPAESEAEVVVSLGDSSLKAENLRLYMNDMPVRSGDDFREITPGEYAVKVSLARGDNRLYAMAGRPGDADARSGDLILFHSGPDNPGRLHVLSLGVGRYERNALSFPGDDAKEFAEFIQGHGVGSSKEIGEIVVLRDDEVGADGVQGAFERIRRKVKGRPQDTIVVFLAGHADILQGRDAQPTYSLLLPKFPFPKDDPLLVAIRGPGVASTIRKAPEGTFLPYSAIYRNLASLDALQRLVIVDACQAESILDDPGVRLLDQLKAMARETRQTRTNYFFASRRGEAAGETKVLNHGLLTYVMLKGMGAPNLATPPREVAEFRQYPSADVDRDGIVTTRELHAYVDRILPTLAETLTVAARGGGPPPPVARPARRFADTRVEASGPSFPLVAIPTAPPVSASRRAEGNGR